MTYNKSLKKIPMPTQEREKRSKNFAEVNLGYSAAMALEEGSRCLGCKDKPCSQNCPVGVDIPAFLEQVKAGDFQKAYELISATNSLPAICGRVCPQENQCEAKCVRGKKGDPVAIGALERFCADYVLEQGKTGALPAAVSNGKKVAVVGSGPSGLTAAGDLVKLGYKVTIFEALHQPGGVLTYGIPPFRLPKNLVQTEIAKLIEAGVELQCNMVIGKVLTLKELREDYGYDAIFIGSGAGLPNFMNIPGENLKGVYSANEFLTRINLMKAYAFPHTDTPIRIGKIAAIVGGGNVAMDAARCAKRLGAETVYVIYRRSEKEMPARLEEVSHAKEEGIIFKTLVNPTEICAGENNLVDGLKCLRMTLGEADAAGRKRPVPVENSEFYLRADTVIMAIGNSPNPLLTTSTPGLKVDTRGRLVADSVTGATSLSLVYAGGDAVTGAATVISAMGAGKRGAIAIHKVLTEQ